MFEGMVRQTANQGTRWHWSAWMPGKKMIIGVKRPENPV
jgi:hypothetical protein